MSKNLFCYVVIYCSSCCDGINNASDDRSQVGHRARNCNHDGPRSQRAEDKCWAVTPLVKRSAGLSADRQYFQLVEIDRISPTRWWTNGFSFFWLAIQYSTIWLSHHKYNAQSIQREILTNSLHLVASTAAISSNLGSVICFSGAALDFDITNEA